MGDANAWPATKFAVAQHSFNSHPQARSDRAKPAGCALAGGDALVHDYESANESQDGDDGRKHCDRKKGYAQGCRGHGLRSFTGLGPVRIIALMRRRLKNSLV